MKQNLVTNSTKNAPAHPNDPVAVAKAAHLRYVSDTIPGIKRLQKGKNWRYIGADGQLISDSETLSRIKSLAIPLAYTDVWICPYPDGHIQATARDAKGRKQYRYHAEWRSIRDSTKFERVFEFGLALPAIRARLDADLSRKGLPREKILAVVVRLLETTHIRIGNEEYARQNNSYGLTTLHNEHVEINGSKNRVSISRQKREVSCD
jgi:DNA topoisomerase-1